MRTTVTLDDDVATQLQDLAARLRKPFKTVLNDTIRKGIGAGKSRPAKPLRLKTWDSGGLRPGFDETKYNQLVDELEVEARAEKLEQGR
jgi:predicted transcriptional regulator